MLNNFIDLIKQIARDVTKLPSKLNISKNPPSSNYNKLVVTDNEGNISTKDIISEDDLIFEYVHSGNKVLNVESIDYDNHIFTITNHRLKSNDRLILSYKGIVDMKGVCPIHQDYLDGGYRVNVVDENNFKLYIYIYPSNHSRHESSLVTLSKLFINEVDLTKWHFEYLPRDINITISNVSNIDNGFIVEEYGYSTKGLYYISTNRDHYNTSLVGYNNSGYTKHPHGYTKHSIHNRTITDYRIDNVDNIAYKTITTYSLSFNENNSKSVVSNKVVINQVYPITPLKELNTIELHSGYIANNYKIKVYRKRYGY